MSEETKSAETTEENSSSLPEVHRMVDMGSAVVRTAHGNIHCLTIVGQVEGHMLAAQGTKTTKYEHVMPLLAALEEHDDIAELIAGMSKPTVSLVRGGSHSIGIPLAVAAKTSFAVPSAAMTVHPVRMTGMMIAAPQTYNYFDRLQERIVEFVTTNSRISRKEFLALMLKTGEMSSDVGSVLYGREAVSKGIIDRVGGLSDALAELYRQIDESGGEKKTG